MATVTFDTLDFTRKLRDAGFDDKQSEAIVRVIADSHNALVTNDHFNLNMERINNRFTLLQWMIGFNLAFTIAILWKIFS